MYEYYFTFRSVTQAQKALAALSEGGLFAALIRAPSNLSSYGCGYALRLISSAAAAAAGLLRQSGVRPDRILRLDSAGHAEEVRL